MIIFWLLGGIVVVSVAFFIPGTSTELWPNINAAGIATFLYVVALTAYAFRPPLPQLNRAIGWFAVLGTSVWIGIGWRGMDETTHWQHDRLLSVKEVITRGMILAELPAPFLKTLEAYHNQQEKNKLTIGQLFRQQFPALTVGGNFRDTSFTSDKIVFSVQSISDHDVFVIGFGGHCKGREAQFTNFNGQHGIVQLEGILTEKGFSYDWQN
jgi:hypothetical protein